MNWKWELFFEAIPFIMDGLLLTIALTISCYLFALTFGFMWVGLRYIPNRFVNWLITWIMEFIRSTPPLVQLFFIYYAWPMVPVVGVTLSAFTSAVLCIGLHYSTYISEVYRSGIEGVGKGQWEASTALNLSTTQKWLKVILPQAIPPTIPMLGNYFIIMFKEIPLASTIGVIEILSRANTFGANHFRYLESLTVVALIFLILSYPSALLINKLEEKINRRFSKDAVVTK